MMKILIESHSLIPPRTGIGRSVEKLVKQLNQHEGVEELTLLFSLFPYSQKWYSIDLLIKSLGLEANYYRIPIPYGFLLNLWNRWDRPKIDHLLPEVDLIHGPAHVLPSHGSAATVFTVHDTSLLDHPEWYPEETRLFARQIEKGIRQADQILVPSESVKFNLCKTRAVSSEKVHVVPHEIDKRFHALPYQEKARFRQEQLGFDFPYLFWSGEINPRKNLPLIFQCLKHLRQRGYRDLRLILSGTRGYQSQEILQQALDMGLSISNDQDSLSTAADILLCGYVSEENLAKLYTGAELFVFPSWDEGFGYPILEAMASATPVISSSLGSMPELAANHALLLNPHEGAEPFTDTIQRLLSDPSLYAHYQEAGIARSREYQSFNWIERILQVYTQALETRISRIA